MKISNYAFCFLLNILFLSTLNAQTWTSYVSQQKINDLLDTGTELYMATEGGLVVMNKATLQKTVYNKTSTGLTDNHLISVAQAPNGDVWVGTEGATLERFDGTNFQDVSIPNHANFSTTHTHLLDLEIAPNGDIWFATDDGVFHKQGSIWSHYGTAEFGTNFFEPWDIAISNAGEVFVASLDLFKLENGTWTNVLGTSTIQNYLDAKLFFSSTGDLFMSGDLGKIGRFDGTNWVEYNSPVANGAQVKEFAEDTNGEMYVRTDYDGIFKLTGTNWLAVTDAQTQAADDEATFLHIDAQNNRWLNRNIHLSVNNAGTIQNTLISDHTLETSSSRKISLRDNGSVYFVTYSQDNIAMKDATNNWSFLPTPTSIGTWENFTDIIVFADNDIWLSSDSGLYHYDGTSWISKLSQACRSMIADSQGKIYIRGSNQVYVVTNGVVSEYNNSNSPLAGSSVAGHGVDAADNLWIAEGGTSTVRKVSTAGVWTEYTQANHPGLDEPRGDFHADVNGNIWVPKNGVGAIKFDGTTFTNPYTGNIGQMANYDVSSIESDASGKMYFAHQYGVTTWDNGQWEDLLISDVPQSASIHDAEIEIDNTGNLWWASSRYGVFAMAAALLPVDLVDFSAETVSDKSIKLFWETASEINNDYFSIEHSTDGENFREIAKRVGNGTTSEGQIYAHLHENVAAGQHYYRLKQVDFDGRFEYSDIVTVQIRPRDNELSLMPNPTSGIIKLDLEKGLEKETDLQIINAQGQLVFSDVLSNGAKSSTLDISDLSHGIYYLRMLVGADLITKRIVKTH